MRHDTLEKPISHVVTVGDKMYSLLIDILMA